MMTVPICRLVLTDIRGEERAYKIATDTIEHYRSEKLQSTTNLQSECCAYFDAVAS